MVNEERASLEWDIYFKCRIHQYPTNWKKYIFIQYTYYVLDKRRTMIWWQNKYYAKWHLWESAWMYSCLVCCGWSNLSRTGSERKNILWNAMLASHLWQVLVMLTTAGLGLCPTSLNHGRLDWVQNYVVDDVVNPCSPKIAYLFSLSVIHLKDKSLLVWSRWLIKSK